MFLVDDILLSPIHGFFWLAKQIHNAVEQETVITPEQITAELSDLYMMLDIGQIEPEEFDKREAELLDLLDELQNAAQENAKDNEDEDDEDEDFDDEDEFDEETDTDEEDEDEFVGEDEFTSQNEFVGKNVGEDFDESDDTGNITFIEDWEN